MKRFFMVGALMWGLLEASPGLGRPLVTDDVGVVDPGTWELETGGARNTVKEGAHSAAPIILTVGLAPGLEVGAESAYLHANLEDAGREKGFGDLTVATKYRLVEEREWLPAVSLTAALKLPTASRQLGLGTGRADVGLNGILTKGVGPALIHVNCGYTAVGSAPGLRLKDLVHGGVGLEWPLKERVTAVMEVFGSSRSEKGGKNSLATHVGLLFRVRPGLVLDAALGRGVRSRSVGPDLHATLGLTWAFRF